MGIGHSRCGNCRYDLQLLLRINLIKRVVAVPGDYIEVHEASSI